MGGDRLGKKAEAESKADKTNGEGMSGTTGRQEETPSGLIGWVMHGAPENGSVIIYCCAVQCTWLTVMSPVMVSATLFWGEEVATVCKQMQGLFSFTYKYALSRHGG